MFVPRRKHSYGFPRPVTGLALLFLYVNDVRTSQETFLWVSTTCYGDDLIFLYVNYVRTSQETRADLHGLAVRIMLSATYSMTASVV
jgi:hypothetical protein